MTRAFSGNRALGGPLLGLARELGEVDGYRPLAIQAAKTVALLASWDSTLALEAAVMLKGLQGNRSEGKKDAPNPEKRLREAITAARLGRSGSTIALRAVETILELIHDLDDVRERVKAAMVAAHAARGSLLEEETAKVWAQAVEALPTAEERYRVARLTVFLAKRRSSLHAVAIPFIDQGRLTKRDHELRAHLASTWPWSFGSKGRKD